MHWSSLSANRDVWRSIFEPSSCNAWHRAAAHGADRSKRRKVPEDTWIGWICLTWSETMTHMTHDSINWPDGRFCVESNKFSERMIIQVPGRIWHDGALERSWISAAREKLKETNRKTETRVAWIEESKDGSMAWTLGFKAQRGDGKRGIGWSRAKSWKCDVNSVKLVKLNSESMVIYMVINGLNGITDPILFRFVFNASFVFILPSFHSCAIYLMLHSIFFKNSSRFGVLLTCYDCFLHKQEADRRRTHWIALKLELWTPRRPWDGRLFPLGSRCYI